MRYFTVAIARLELETFSIAFYALCRVNMRGSEGRNWVNTDDMSLLIIRLVNCYSMIFIYACRIFDHFFNADSIKYFEVFEKKF